MTPERDQRITVSILGFHYPCARCRSCKAPIVWALNDTTGKFIPMDVLPDPTGLFVADRQGLSDRGQVPVMRRANADETTGNRWTIHFATCPNAAEHRKPKTETPPLTDDF